MNLLNTFRTKLLKLFSAFDIPYKKGDLVQNILLLLVVVILICGAFSGTEKERKLVDYTPDDIYYADQYIKQFDAWEKGQLHLDIVPDSRLETLENVYDRGERDASGAKYLWDHAYFEGRYYSYFGVAPLLTVYYPTYAFTDKLPNVPLTCLILAITAIITTVLAYREVVLRFTEKPNLFLFVIGAAAVVYASSVYLGVLCSDIYYIAVLSAQAYFMAFVFFSFRAMRSRVVWLRSVLLALAAIMLVLTVCSRPTVALLSLAVFPIFFEYLFKRPRESAGKIVATVAPFALVLIGGAVFVMWYNAARFNSPFDFGANYQLTVSDVSKNTIDFRYIFSSLFSYFLCPLFFKDTAPYLVATRNLILPDNQRYFYADKTCGIFGYGLPVGILLYSSVMKIDRERGKSDRARDFVVWGALALSVAVGFADFCMGGVNMRYVFDILPIISLISAAVLLALVERLEGRAKAFGVVLSISLFAMSIWASAGVVGTFSA